MLGVVHFSYGFSLTNNVRLESDEHCSFEKKRTQKWTTPYIIYKKKKKKKKIMCPVWLAVVRQFLFAKEFY